jgi:hypothetical protein
LHCVPCLICLALEKGDAGAKVQFSLGNKVLEKAAFSGESVLDDLDSIGDQIMLSSVMKHCMLPLDMLDRVGLLFGQSMQK